MLLKKCVWPFPFNYKAVLHLKVYYLETNTKNLFHLQQPYLTKQNKHALCFLPHRLHPAPLKVPLWDLLATYFIMVSVSLFVADLILFWASRCVIPSVLTPSMAEMMSPWARLPPTALLPGVIYRGEREREGDHSDWYRFLREHSRKKTYAVTAKLSRNAAERGL